MSLEVRLFRSDRSCLALVLLPSIVLFALSLGGRDLWDPDEPRAGVVVRGLLEGGSRAVLRRDGEPYLEKPPLYHWLAAAASAPAGRVTEAALRLPSSLAGIATLVVLFYLGRDLFGRRAGALAAIALATTQGFFMEARWAHPDMLWTFFLTLAGYAFLRAWRGGGRPADLAVFYLAIGCAVLTKGPAGLVLPILAGVVFLATARDLAFLRRAGPAWGLPLALLPSALWLVAWSSATGRPFPLGGALARIGERFLHGIHHPRPFLHVFTSLPVECVPWVVFLPAAFWHSVPRGGERRDPETAYLYSWLLTFLSVFALSAEKRGVYLLPLLPLLALLVGRLWDTALLAWDPSPVDRPIHAGILAWIAIAAGAAILYLPQIAALAPDLRDEAALLAAAALLTGAAALLARRRGGAGAAMAVFAGGSFLALLLVAARVLPALDLHKSARPFAARTAAASAGARLAIYPERRDAYSFYIGRGIEVIPSRDGLRSWVAEGSPALCLMEEDQYEVERRVLGVPLRVLDRQRVGHRAMVLVAAVPPRGIP